MAPESKIKERSSILTGFTDTLLTFATFEYEGDTIPALVLDIEHAHSVGGCDRSSRNCGVVQIALLSIPLFLRVAHVLAQHHIIYLEGADAPENFDLKFNGDTYNSQVWSSHGGGIC